MCVSTSCQEENTSGSDHREAIVAVHQSGMSHKAISKQFGIHYSAVRGTVYKWTAFKRVGTESWSGDPRKFSPSSDYLMLRDINKIIRDSSCDL